MAPTIELYIDSYTKEVIIYHPYIEWSREIEAPFSRIGEMSELMRFQCPGSISSPMRDGVMPRLATALSASSPGLCYFVNLSKKAYYTCSLVYGAGT